MTGGRTGCGDAMTTGATVASPATAGHVIGVAGFEAAATVLGDRTGVIHPNSSNGPAGAAFFRTAVTGFGPGLDTCRAGATGGESSVATL